MKFDPVHDSQAIHRALVRAFSYPGIPVSFKDEAARAPVHGLPQPLTALGLTLLDPETSFYGEGVEILGELTGGKRRGASEAAFVFLTEWDEEKWARAFHDAARGTLADPHWGATVVAWAPHETPGRAWTATGPGIEKPLTLFLPGYGTWVNARAEACQEFPLGVDWLWLREDSSVIALPRTTRLVPAEKGA